MSIFVFLRRIGATIAKHVCRRPSFSDGISAVNQTNLALKGIIGIGAMAKISSAVGQSVDADHYQVENLISCAFESNSDAVL